MVININSCWRFLFMASTRKSAASSSNSNTLLSISEYTQAIQKIADQITSLQTKTIELKKIHGQYLLAAGSEKKTGVSAEIVALNQEIDKEINGILLNIQRLARDNQNATSSKPDEMEFRHQLHKTITDDFIKIVEIIAKIFLDSKAKQKTLVNHMFQAYKPLMNENSEEIKTSEELISMIQATLVKSNQAQEASEYVKSKDKEIKKIEVGLEELRSLSVQLSILVAAQAQQVDLLSVNVEEAKAAVKAGKKGLEESKRFAPS